MELFFEWWISFEMINSVGLLITPHPLSLFQVPTALWEGEQGGCGKEEEDGQGEGPAAHLRQRTGGQHQWRLPHRQRSRRFLTLSTSHLQLGQANDLNRLTRLARLQPDACFFTARSRFPTAAVLELWDDKRKPAEERGEVIQRVLGQSALPEPTRNPQPLWAQSGGKFGKRRSPSQPKPSVCFNQMRFPFCSEYMSWMYSKHEKKNNNWARLKQGDRDFVWNDPVQTADQPVA